jgi:hypothetical protein
MKYDEATINKLTDAIANGDTIIDACRKANISKQTFYEWLNDPNKADFADAIKNAQEEFRINIVGQLEHSLWDRARGFDFEEQHTKYATDAKTKQVYVKEQITKKTHVVQDTGALVFALTNLAPDKWKNKQNIEATGRDGRDLYPHSNRGIDLDKLTDEQRAAVLSIGEDILNKKD